VDWIAERHEQQQKAAQARAESSAAATSERQRLIEQSQVLWERLVEEICSRVHQHNQLKISSPQWQISKLAADAFLRLTSVVVEPVEGLWFSAPQQVALEVRFDPARCTIESRIPGRGSPTSLYLERSLSGAIAIHSGHQAISQEQAAKAILCILLDIIDPL